MPCDSRLFPLIRIVRRRLGAPPQTVPQSRATRRPAGPACAATRWLDWRGVLFMAAGPPLRLVLMSAVVTAAIVQAGAQQATPPPPSSELADRCPGLVASDRPRVIPAMLRTALASDQVRITYAGHSTFLIESPRLVRIATDYNDYVRPPVRPDIVTMNHAHSTHYTDRPEADIKHVLRGWGPSPDQPARHDMTFEDVRVRNVPTN